MAIIINARVQEKIATYEEWMANDLPLLRGEWANVVDANGSVTNYRIGNGVSPFRDLPNAIRYDQGAFVPLLPSGDLPTPSVDVAYTLQFVGDVLNVMYWDGSAWSVSDSLELPKGEKGDPFTYEDFTPEQLAELKGEQGEGFTNATVNNDGDLIITKSDATTINAGNVKGTNGKNLRPDNIYSVLPSTVPTPSDGSNIFIAVNSTNKKWHVGESGTTTWVELDIEAENTEDIRWVLSDAIQGQGDEDIETNYLLNTTFWEQNGLNADGTNVAAATRVRLKDYKEGYKVSITAVDADFVVMFFNDSKVKISEHTWVGSGVYENANASYYRIQVRKNSSNPNYTPSEFFATGSVVKGYKKSTVLKKVAIQDQLSQGLSNLSNSVNESLQDLVTNENIIDLIETGEFSTGMTFSDLAFSNMAKFDSGVNSPASSGRNIWKLDFLDPTLTDFPYTVSFSVMTSRGNDNNISVALKEKEGVFTPLVNGTATGSNLTAQTGTFQVTEPCIVWFNSFKDHSTKIFYNSGSGQSANLYERFSPSALKGNQLIFDKALCISSPESGELCAHGSVLEVDKYNTGDFYLAYNPNKVSPTETISNTQCSLTYWNVLRPNDIEKIDVFVKGMEVGSWKIPTGGDSPYEPCIFNNNATTFKYYANVNNENDALGVRWAYRDFNKTTKTLDNTINNCILKYNDGTSDVTVPLSLTNVATMYNVKLGTTYTSFARFFQTILSWELYNGAYYVMFGSAENNSGARKGFVAKTTDGITFEFVSFLMGTAGLYSELSYKIVGDKFYVINREGSSYSLDALDLVSLTWQTTVKITTNISSELGRPFISEYKGKLIALGNTTDNQSYYKVGSNTYRSWRSGVTVWEINKETLQPTVINKFTNIYGCHYFTLKEDLRGGWWFSYSEDRRQLTTINPNNNNRSNIGLLRFEDLIGY